MFCSNCGKQLEDGDKVCGFCGVPVQSESNVTLSKDKPDKTDRNVCSVLYFIAMYYFFSDDSRAFSSEFKEQNNIGCTKNTDCHIIDTGDNVHLKTLGDWGFVA